MPPFKVARFVNTPNGIQSYLERPGAAPVMHKLFGTKAEAVEAMAAAQAQGWNVVNQESLPRIGMNYNYDGKGLPGTAATTFDEILEGQRRSTIRPVGYYKNVQPGDIVEVFHQPTGRTIPVQVTDRRSLTPSELSDADWQAISEVERWTPEFLKSYTSSKPQWEQFLYEPLNNSIRTPGGINTAATSNLNDTQVNRHYPPTQPVDRQTPVSAIANVLAVQDWGVLQATKSNLSPAQINRNYYNPSPNLDLLMQGFRANPLPVHDNAVAYNNFIQTSRNASKNIQYSPESLGYAPYDSGLGAVESRLKWGTINKRPGYYPESVLEDPKYSDALHAWNRHIIQKKSGFVPTGNPESPYRFVPGQIVAPQKSPQVLSDLEQPQFQDFELLNLRQSLTDLEYKQRYGMSLGNAQDLTFDTKLGMTELGNGGWIVRPQNQNKQLGEAFNSEPVQMVRSDVKRGVGGVSDYRLMPPNVTGYDAIDPSLQPRNIPFGVFDSLTKQVSRIAGETVNRNPAISSKVFEYINPKISQIVDDPNYLNNADAIQLVNNQQSVVSPPLFRAKVQSDSYPMAPLWAREPRIVQEIPLPVPTREEALASARATNKAARAAYRAEQQALINQRPGSFNIVTEPEYIETFAPTDPASDIIPGVYSKGKPFQVEVDGNGHVEDLPNNLDVHIPGMGYFPVTRGRTLERIPLSSLEPPTQLNADGTFEMQRTYSSGNKVKSYSLPDDTYERDGNVRYMMDALQGLQTKERVTQQAIADFQASLNSPTVSDGEVYAKQRRAAIHQQELEAAQKAYQSALNILEPQPASQKTRTTINVPALGDYPDLLRSHGLEIMQSTPVESGIQIQASGYIPVEKQIALSGELSSRLNREQLVLPPDVTIANSYYKAFKDAGIPDQALVKDVQWGKNKSGKPTVVNPGTVVGQWEGQRITRGNVKEPSVREIPTAAAPVYESDPETSALLRARDRAKNQRANSLIEKLNIKRASRGEPLLAVGNNGQLFHLPHESISVATPDDISNAVFNAAINKRSVFGDETTIAFNQLLDNAQAENSRSAVERMRSSNAPVYSSPDPDARYSNYQSTMPKPPHPKIKQPRNMESYRDDWQIAQSDVHPMDRVSTNEVSPVVRPATVDLNQIPHTIDVQAVPVVDTPHYFRTGIPIEGDDVTWAYNRPSRVTPEQPREIYSDLWHETQYPAASQPQSVIVQDPANTWNRYIPAATALGGLGLGAGVGYVMAPRQSEEEEQLRQQLMQQQMYLQRRLR